MTYPSKRFRQLSSLYGALEGQAVLRLQAMSAAVVVADSALRSYRDIARNMYTGHKRHLDSEDEIDWRANEEHKKYVIRTIKVINQEAEKRRRLAFEAKESYMALRIKTKQIEYLVKKEHHLISLNEIRKQQVAAADRFLSVRNRMRTGHRT
jgi:hypothetical protein